MTLLLILFLGWLALVVGFLASAIWEHVQASRPATLRDAFFKDRG